MKIEVLYSADCPNYLGGLEMIREMLAETGIPAEVELVRVETPEDAVRLHFIGSPTVHIDGVDVEMYATFAPRAYGLGCRKYASDDGPSDWPSKRALRDSIEMGRLAELDMLSSCC